jgi:hypothetical protein
MGALCGLSAKETLLMPPGALWDVWELYLRGQGVKKDGDGDA